MIKLKVPQKHIDRYLFICIALIVIGFTQVLFTAMLKNKFDETFRYVIGGMGLTVLTIGVVSFIYMVELLCRTAFLLNRRHFRPH